MKAKINSELCQGHGRCYAIAPDIFEEDEDGHAQVTLDTIPEDRRADVELAVANCPEGAIEILKD